MKKKNVIILFLIILGLAIILLLPNILKKSDKVQMNVGWQTAWAGQGQIIQALIHTNVPELYKTDVSFVPFLFGPDQNEAAITGSIQLTNSGIVPTINLLANSQGWIIVARQVDFPLYIIARKGSDINKLSDLKGKNFGIPFGGGSHPYAIQRIQETGLSIGDGVDQVHIINLNPSNQIIAMKKGEVDAVAIWDPTAATLIKQGGYIIDSTRYVSFVSVNKSYAEKNKQNVVNFLKAYIEATYYVASHKDQSNNWFATVSGIDQGTINSIPVIEPNLNAKNIQDIDWSITKSDVSLTQSVADKMLELKLIKNPVNIINQIDGSYLNQAMLELKQSGYFTPRIEVKN